MFNNVCRVMAGDEIGSWMETVPDTVYRNRFGWLICRTRGARHGGRITGSRFYVITRDNTGKPWRLRGNKGFIRYFGTPHAAALAACAHSKLMVQRWEKSKLVTELEALALEAKTLRSEIEASKQTRANLLVEINALNGRKKRLETKGRGTKEESARTVETASNDSESVQDSMPWLLRSATKALRRVYH